MDEHPSRDRAGAAVRSSGRRLPNVKVPWLNGERGMRVHERGTPNGELRATSVSKVDGLPAGEERWEVEPAGEERWEVEPAGEERWELNRQARSGGKLNRRAK